MPTIDTRPTNVDILCYAGDTLTLNITSSVDYSGHEWSGHVKLDPSSNAVDAEFSFVHNGSTLATLSAEDTASLGLVATTLASRTFSTKSGTINPQAVAVIPAQYTGVWDIQVQIGGVVTTLVRGTIKVDTDVTRL